ncbi:xanthine dehydrogenase accessory protein XdhC [Aggregicoccus sp. 17bor-14]|uniref:xanthine dehydrogenase accessory protein XdhC n=1 Tax=Myxococcaceae TaxID=31 RepID=UPI00129C351D|nr:MULTISPECIES: xanthine dehydrogenase accessory protein XdhC [Myxococcaceae]MBF5045613.1 xanthine dehydrogenase accessory protein XdhC [Simulacricoccus sp. 17bor-14]MRI91350.1 xanthine dehydrogenase accessory protein XdhC [Aggregicoccus sp. 17bor-14]
MWDWLTKLTELTGAGLPVAVATVVDCKGSTPRERGARMLVLEDGRFFGTIGGGHLEQCVLEDARATLRSGEARLHRYPLGTKLAQCCGGVMDVFVEPMNVGPRLALFGAGHVAQALCQVLQGTPFSVDLVDERAEWVEAPSLPAPVRRHHVAWDEFCDGARWSEHSRYVLVMTHRHDLDQEIIAHVLGRPTRFIGLIGSRSKWARFRQRLTLRGMAPEALERVHCPVGVDTGGKAPQEVAISIAAQLLQVHYARGAEATPPSVVHRETA